VNPPFHRKVVAALLIARVSDSAQQVRLREILGVIFVLRVGQVRGLCQQFVVQFVNFGGSIVGADICSS